jgi:hypothetical protein
MIRGINYLNTSYSIRIELFCSEFFDDKDLGVQHNNVSFNLSFCDLFELTHSSNVLVAIKFQALLVKLLIGELVFIERLTTLL